MRRIKMIMGTAAVLVGMLALNAGPAMADELDGSFIEDDFTSDGVFFVDEGTATFDELCSPGLSDRIFIPGCIFSDSIEEDFDFDEDEIFFVADFDFNDDDFDHGDFDHGDFDFDHGDFDFDDNDDDDNDDDNNNDDNERESVSIIR